MARKAPGGGVMESTQPCPRSTSMQPRALDSGAPIQGIAGRCSAVMAPSSSPACSQASSSHGCAQRLASGATLRLEPGGCGLPLALSWAPSSSPDLPGSSCLLAANITPSMYSKDLNNHP